MDPIEKGPHVEEYIPKGEDNESPRMRGVPFHHERQGGTGCYYLHQGRKKVPMSKVGYQTRLV